MQSFMIIGVGRLPRRRSRTTVFEFVGQAIVILFILVAVLAGAKAARGSAHLIPHFGSAQPVAEQASRTGVRPATSKEIGQR